MYAFHLNADPAAKSIDIDFDYLSPTSPQVGLIEISRDLLMLEWNEVLFYPAGYYTRQIPIEVELTLPTDFQFGSALEIASTHGARTAFKRTSVDTLVDSPVFAGRYAEKFDLDPGSQVPVNLDVFTDRKELLAVNEVAVL